MQGQAGEQLSAPFGEQHSGEQAGSSGAISNSAPRRLLDQDSCVPLDFFPEAAWKVRSWDGISAGGITTTFWQIPAAEGKALAKDPFDPSTPVGLKC